MQFHRPSKLKLKRTLLLCIFLFAKPMNHRLFLLEERREGMDPYPSYLRKRKLLKKQDIPCLSPKIMILME